MANKTKLLIHIGTHKTGTTAIQKYLKTHVKPLKEEGINYIKFKYRKQNQRLLDSDKAYKNELKTYLKENVIEGVNNLISFEGFAGNLFHLYTNYKTVANTLHEISSGFRPQIIVFFRRQDQFIESAFMQSIHQGKSLNFSDFFDKSNLKNLNWLHYSNYYSDLFGQDNIICVPYSPIRFKQESVVNIFGKAIGSDSMMGHKENYLINIGLSKMAMNILTSLSEDLKEDERSLLKSRLQSHYNNGLFSSYGFLNSDDRQYLAEMFDDQNNMLAEKYWDRNYLDFKIKIPEKKDMDSEGKILEDLILISLKNERKLLSELYSTKVRLKRYEESKVVQALNYIRNRMNVFNSLLKIDI